MLQAVWGGIESLNGVKHGGETRLFIADVIAKFGGHSSYDDIVEGSLTTAANWIMHN